MINKRLKIFIMAYARANLGDDLFLYMLLKKYPQVYFYINIKEKKYKKILQNFTNITIIEQEDTDKILKSFSVEQYDAYIYIGGSIFMEGGKVYNLSEEFYEFIEKCKQKQIPFFYVSSNYGPYYTQDYLELSRKTFNTCTDICFRDKYSYEKFKDCKSVRYAPDLAFTFDIGEKIPQKKNTVGISVIDLSIREKLIPYQHDYMELMKNSILEYNKNGYEITLFSFCEHEADEKAIKEVLTKLPEEVAKKIQVVYYKGDIEDYLKEYSQMEYMLCTRFHAMILSSVFNQKLSVLSYSDKIDNVIKDLEFNINTMRFENIQDKNIISLEEYKEIPDAKINKVKEMAKEQLRKVDEFIKING